MKHLYEIEARWYVMAKDEEDAQMIRPDLSVCSVFACEVASADVDWWDAIPFGSDDDRTVGQIMKQMSEAKK